MIDKIRVMLAAAWIAADVMMIILFLVFGTEMPNKLIAFSGVLAAVSVYAYYEKRGWGVWTN